jgi:iron-sulfur cluster assembly protein
MITLTDSAASAVKKFITSADKPLTGLRIRVEDGGCSGLQYGMRLEEFSVAGDTVLDCNGVQVFVDADSLARVEGVSIDFVESFEGSGFRFSNPNARNGCACGKSFSA